jgi:hypothetical protein
MNSTIQGTGKCLCGKVEIRASAMSSSVGACHCSMCRKWTGGPLLVIDCNTEVKITGEEYVSAYSSSDWRSVDFALNVERTYSTN